MRRTREPPASCSRVRNRNRWRPAPPSSLATRRTTVTFDVALDAPRWSYLLPSPSSGPPLLSASWSFPRGAGAGGAIGRGVMGRGPGAMAAGGTTRRGAATGRRTNGACPGGGVIRYVAGGAWTAGGRTAGAWTAGAWTAGAGCGGATAAAGAGARGGAGLGFAWTLDDGEGPPVAGAGVTVAGTWAGVAVGPAKQAPSKSVVPSAAAAYAGRENFMVHSSGTAGRVQPGCR